MHRHARKNEESKMLMSCFLYTSKICCTSLSVSVLVLRVPNHLVSRRCCRGGPGGSTAPPLNCGYLSRIPFACLLPLLYAAWIFVLQCHFPLLFCMTYLFTVRIALLYIYIPTRSDISSFSYIWCYFFELVKIWFG